MKKCIWVFFLMLLIGMGMVSKSGVASAEAMSYSVKANIPDNQIDKNLTYFDLRMSPGETQTISLTVQNSSTEEITLIIEPNTAITNQNGVIDYSSNDHEKDSSLKYAFSDIISPAQEVTLAGNETKEVSFTIEMPEESFDGIILGGFHVYEVNLDNESTSEQIKNKYAYVIGAKLSVTDTIVEPDLTLNEVEATLINYRTHITANLQNTEATIINDLEVTAQITKEGEDEVLYETTNSNLSMAPNSNFDFPISLNNQALEAGKYRIYIHATDGDQTWEFDKTFEIGAGEAADLNEEAVELVETNNTILYVIIGALVAICIILFIVLLKNKKTKDNKIEE